MVVCSYLVDVRWPSSGKTWTVSLAANVANGYSYVGFTTSSFGFALPATGENRVIWFTRDAGFHWNSYAFS